MATLFDYYIINLFINETEVDVATSEYSFSLSDSIYQLYPSAFFTIHDFSGVYQELLAFVEGNKFTVEFGDKDSTNKSNYIISSNHLVEIETSGKLGGTVEVPLIHEYFNEQQIKNKGYKNRISFIIKDLVDSYDFKDTDIDDTGNEDYWLQTLQTDAHFIQNTLLPNSFSRNATKTPFFCFITTDNIFHFRNIQSIMDEGNAATIEYKQHSGDTQKGPSYKGIVQSTTRWSEKIKNHWKLRKRNLFKIDRNNGTLVEEEDSIKDYPQRNPWNVPILNNLDNITGYENFLFNESTTGKQENIKGQKINTMRDSMFLEHFFLVVPLDPQLHSGKTIQLNTYMINGDKPSTNFAGKYIIEDCEHVWDGKNSTAFTKLIVGRKYLQVPKNYVLKGALM